ncbi:UDP-N-acetylmuramate dehydrogenase [Urechidicola sp. KH5]
MKTLQNVSLKPYNTFGIDVKTSKFLNVESIKELQEFLSLKEPFFLLGGGSNMLLTKDINSTTLHINLKGIEVLSETDSHVKVKAQAGENWHEFVLWCIAQNYGGIENLSLIPGNVGTSPIQNIGAYGVELKDVFYKLKAIEISTGKRKIFDKEECNFGYRDSIFKNELKGEYIITSVIFNLTKSKHTLNISYGAIQSELSKNHIEQPSIKDVSNAVIAIRQSKLPDPKEIGNSGSFFKNPVIPMNLFENIQKIYPTVPSYPISDSQIKVPAGWLIEQCGFKGKRFGDAGIHTNQALVLVNYGNASGKDIYNVAIKIQESVKQKFGIDLEMEVNII